MEKYFVTKEEAIALAEIGCKFNTPFYYDRTNDVMFDVEVYMGYDDAGHNEIVNCDFDDLQFERSSDKEILAPTIHEALEWFRSKGEVFKIDIKLKRERVEYVTMLLDCGEWVREGKYPTYFEAEKGLLEYYIDNYKEKLK